MFFNPSSKSPSSDGILPLGVSKNPSESLRHVIANVRHLSCQSTMRTPPESTATARGLRLTGRKEADISTLSMSMRLLSHTETAGFVGGSFILKDSPTILAFFVGDRGPGDRGPGGRGSGGPLMHS